MFLLFHGRQALAKGFVTYLKIRSLLSVDNNSKFGKQRMTRLLKFAAFPGALWARCCFSASQEKT
jgi:hypothetical protein